MTVRDFIQTILTEAPDLDADIYISRQIDDIERESYRIEEIGSFGSNDSVEILIEIM